MNKDSKCRFCGLALVGTILLPISVEWICDKCFYTHQPHALELGFREPTRLDYLGTVSGVNSVLGLDQ